jgi:hypothetical protein
MHLYIFALKVVWNKRKRDCQIDKIHQNSLLAHSWLNQRTEAWTLIKPSLQITKQVRHYSWVHHCSVLPKISPTMSTRIDSFIFSYSLLGQTTSRRYWFKRWPKIFVENDSVTCRRASSPILFAVWGSWVSLAIARENCRRVGSQRHPVCPSLIVSTGPPLLHAITGLWAAIASRGTIPKCSSYEKWTFAY